MDSINLNTPEEIDSNDIHYLLDNTPKDRIFLSSDWHINAHKYGKGKNKINIQNMVSWCKKNIKDNDVFLFLGDICFRYANEEDSAQAQEIMKSIPGKKLLIIGNHDGMQGSDFYENCGFDFIYEYLIHDFDGVRVYFSHRPENVEQIPGVDLNIHGHIHDLSMYFTTNGQDNINVYGNKPFTLEYLLSHKDKLTKANYQVWTDHKFNEAATKRSNLPDSAFGIPEDRKFPLDSEKHINSAIKLFGHASEDKKPLLARRIRSAAKRYNISIKDTSQVAKYLKEDADVMEGMNNIIISTPCGLKLIDIDKIQHWYISDQRNPGDVTEDIWAESIQDAIEAYTPDQDGEKEDAYVFICNGSREDLPDHLTPICVGIISVADDLSYEWKIQYPVRYDDEQYMELYKHEAMSLAAMNPIAGIKKPFIMKVHTNKYNKTIDPTQYLFSPDVVSDKYIAIDEEGHLTILSHKEVADYYLEAEYEFVGDIHRFMKVYEAYRTNKTVDNTFFYTALTGKPMLTEDQIDFDENFKKVDFTGLKLGILSELATVKAKYDSDIKGIKEVNMILPAPEGKERFLFNQYKDFQLETKYCIDGYYVESKILNKRTAYVPSRENIDEALIMSLF